MIGFLEGELLHRLEHTLILRTASGVGYELQAPAPLLAQSITPGMSLRLYVSSVAREQHVALYGFADVEEKRCFEMLIAVRGIGPRLALALLSAFTPAVLEQHIQAEDIPQLAQIPGLGRRTAERICLELRGRLALSAAPMANSPAAELVSALKNLGFSENQARAAVQQLPSEAGSFEERFRQALAALRKPSRSAS